MKEKRKQDSAYQSKPKESSPKKSFKAAMVIGITSLLLLLALFSNIYFNDYFEAIHLSRIQNLFGKSIWIIGLALLGLNISFLIYLLVLYLKYEPVLPSSNQELPKCTVIVPAYNEGSLVYKTLHSLVNSDYPAEKLQIIAIDDGSQDDTYDWMIKAKQALGERIQLLRQGVNQGKRQALYRGFHLATGEIFITVDSDSVVKEDTLRQMVSPFIDNPTCGAVAGNVKVLNKDQALIPKMLHVSFAFSFEFVRSAQSVLGSVLCTPGALSAYRRKAVMKCLDSWINQTFMGKPSTIGEDRAMTNMILKQGYTVKFQKDAWVYTNIPERYKNLYKMFIRWERSNVRENIAMSKFAFTQFRNSGKLGPRLLLLHQWLKIIMAYPMILLMLFLVISYPLVFLTSTLLGVLVFSSIQALFFAKKHNFKESVWAYPYSLFYAFTLFWITPYAIVTASKSGWLTRELTK